MPALVVTPPHVRFKPALDISPSVFLAGSIEMGLAEDWQARAIEVLHAYASVIYNPRRADWDSSWVQSIDNPQFTGQVNWELDMIAKADHVLFYFDPQTKAPITLMELGLCTGRGRSISVCCPEGFWRKGNVDIVCEREGFITYPSLERMLSLPPLSLLQASRSTLRSA